MLSQFLQFNVIKSHTIRPTQSKDINKQIKYSMQQQSQNSRANSKSKQKNIRQKFASRIQFKNKYVEEKNSIYSTKPDLNHSEAKQSAEMVRTQSSDNLSKIRLSHQNNNCLKFNEHCNLEKKKMSQYQVQTPSKEKDRENLNCQQDIPYFKWERINRNINSSKGQQRQNIKNNQIRRSIQNILKPMSKLQNESYIIQSPFVKGKRFYSERKQSLSPLKNKTKKKKFEIILTSIKENNKNINNISKANSYKQSYEKSKEKKQIFSQLLRQKKQYSNNLNSEYYQHKSITSPKIVKKNLIKQPFRLTTDKLIKQPSKKQLNSRSKQCLLSIVNLQKQKTSKNQTSNSQETLEKTNKGQNQIEKIQNQKYNINEESQFQEVNQSEFEEQNSFRFLNMNPFLQT